MDWSRRNFLRRTGLAGAGAAVGGLSTMLDGCAISQRYDVIIRGGQVIDGTGAAPVAADIAIEADRIVQIGLVQWFRQEYDRRFQARSSAPDSSTSIPTPIFRSWSIPGPKARSGRA